jgi:hypothetical protein
MAADIQNRGVSVMVDCPTKERYFMEISNVTLQGLLGKPQKLKMCNGFAQFSPPHYFC